MIKPALVSKSIEVARLALKIYTKLCEELHEKNLMAPAWEWFIGPQAGLNTSLLCIKRHPDLIKEMVDFLKTIGKNNLLELFTIQLKTTLIDEKHYLFIINRIFEPMTLSFTKEELITSGILDKWIEISIQIADLPTKSDLKIEALSFLTEVWLFFPQIFEEDESKALNLINYFKKACKESLLAALNSIVNLFRLLMAFGLNKDPFAPIIYKTLIFILIENANIVEIRSLIINNMMQILAELESIPLSLIIEPWVKHIQISSNNEENQLNYQWNVIDFEFMKFLALQEKISVKNAIQILDVLSKIFLNEVIFSQFAKEIMLIIINRFLTNETLREFLGKLIKIALAIYFAAEKKRKSKKPKEKFKVSSPNPSTEECTEASINKLSSQKNAVIVNFLKNLAELKDQNLIEKLKPLVAHTNLQLKKQLNNKENDKGMIDIMNLWGNPDKISAKYENEYYENIAKEKIKKREEDLRIKSGLDTTGNISQISATSVREILDHKLALSGSFEKEGQGETVRGNSLDSVQENGEGEVASRVNFFVIFHYFSLFFIIFHYFSLFFIIFHYFYYFSLFFIIFHYFSLFFIIFHYFSLFFII